MSKKQIMQKSKLFVALGVLLVSVPASSQTERKAAMHQSDAIQTASILDDVHAVSPALERYTKERLLGDLWKRPDLSPRDRSIVTLAALIARNQTVRMPYYLNLALDNGVKPSEVSEIITHLAFYSGWENAMSAVVAAKEVFRKRGIGLDQLPPASVELLPLNEAAEKQRATNVEQNFGAVAPGVVQYTTDVLFRDLWLRPGLAPRDRSLLTPTAIKQSISVKQNHFWPLGHLSSRTEHAAVR